MGRPKKGLIEPGIDVNRIKVEPLGADLVVRARRAIYDRITCSRCGWPARAPGRILEFHFDKEKDYWTTSIQVCYHHDMRDFLQLLEVTSIWV